MKYEPAKETAKKIRRALKAAFPGIKFYVRTDSYSMGASIDVSWTDGPTRPEVEEVVKAFESSKFDGMQDMKVTSGYICPETGEHLNGADYVMCSRKRSEELTAKLEAYIHANYADAEGILFREYHYIMNRAEEAILKAHGQDVKLTNTLVVKNEQNSPEREQTAVQEAVSETSGPQNEQTPPKNEQDDFEDMFSICLDAFESESAQAAEQVQQAKPIFLAEARVKKQAKNAGADLFGSVMARTMAELDALHNSGLLTEAQVMAMNSIQRTLGILSEHSQRIN